jgi:conjugative transposon TraM protein
VDRLEQMMEMMQAGSEPDPEMQQIESVLEKILDIQHPERVKEKLKTQSAQQATAFSVEPVNDRDAVSDISQARTMHPFGSELDSAMNPAPYSVFPVIQNGFYSLEEEGQIQQETGNAIPAIIHQTQALVDGATVKMRLLKEVTINGQLIPKDQFIYGTCSINRERLTIAITAIRSENSVLPVSLSAYDLDGIEGIYIPGAITRDVAKQTGDDALQNLQLMSLDPTLGQQAASAGIEAAKGLLSKKSKLIKVTVKAGYKILLVDNV